VAHEDFRAGKLSTGFLDRLLPTLTATRGRCARVAVIAAVLAEYERLGHPTLVEPSTPAADSWRTGRRPAGARREIRRHDRRRDRDGRGERQGPGIG